LTDISILNFSVYFIGIYQDVCQRVFAFIEVILCIYLFSSRWYHFNEK